MHYLSSLLTVLFAFSPLFGIANGFGGVMRVHRRFVGNHHHFDELKQHSAQRRARFLRSTDIVDVPMGGNVTIMMYYTHLAIGTPPKNYTVHIDSGSDILWINCQDCVGCPMDNDTLGIHLSPYNPRTSKTAKIVTRGKDYCKERAPDRKDDPCPFHVGFLDGTKVSGYYVRDFLAYNKVTGDHRTRSARAKVTFGCVDNYSAQSHLGDVYIRSGIEGLIGFGSGNVSIISQLASSGKVRKEFAHCLNPAKGGGIFAIGHVAKPEVKMIPLHPATETFYAAVMRSVDVGGKFADLKAMFVNRLAVIDSGSTMVILPEPMYDYVTKEIFSNKSNLNVYQSNKFSCFNHSGSLDLTGFPTISFHFQDGHPSKLHPVPLTVHPHDYMVQQNNISWCVGFENGAESHPFTLLGDVALANKLVIYDADKKQIGWTEYDCSSSIQLEDDKDGVCAVSAHSESSPTSSN